MSNRSDEVIGEVEFDFPYMVAGACAADFSCRARIKASRGRPAVLSPWPGEPAEAPEILAVDEIKVDVGTYSHVEHKRIYRFVDPDDHLKAMIEAWAGDNGGDLLEKLFEVAGEDDDFADERNDRARDDRLTGRAQA
jgi:hypothetical protein